MSAKLLGLAFDVITPSHASKLVLLKLVDACDDDGTRIFPAVATIARKAQCSERQVQRELKRLLDIRLLILVRPGGRGPGDTAEYRMDVAVMRRIADAGWPQEDEAAEKGDTVSPIAKGDSETPKGDIGAEKGDKLSHPTPPSDPSLDPSIERERAREREAEPKIPDGEMLERLRHEFPHASQADQDEVERAWRALSRPERRASVGDLPMWLADKAPKQTAIAGLAKYLRQKLWTILPKAPTGRPSAGDRVGALSRAWFLLLIEFADRHAEMLRDTRSEPSRILRDRISRALQFAGGWPIKPDELGGIEERAKALVQVMVGSPEHDAWRKHFGKRGVILPEPDKAVVIWMRTQWPPVEEAGDAITEIADMERAAG